MLMHLTHYQTTLSHILKQHQSSYQSLQFVSQLIHSFHNQLILSNHTRTVQIQRMNTGQGIGLRQVILEMNNNLAASMEQKMQIYQTVGKQVLTWVQDLKETVRQIKQIIEEMRQNQNFVNNKLRKIDSQVNRLAKISQNVQKKMFMDNLRQKYNFYEVNNYFSPRNITNKNQQLLEPNVSQIKKINTKLETYITQHKNIIDFVENNLGKNEVYIQQILHKARKIQQNVGNFQTIYRLIRQDKTQTNKKDQKNIDFSNGSNNNVGKYQINYESQERKKLTQNKEKNLNGYDKLGFNCREAYSACTNKISEVSKECDSPADISSKIKKINLYYK